MHAPTMVMEVILIAASLLTVISAQQRVSPLTGADVLCLNLERDRSQIFDNTCDDIDFAEIDVNNIVSWREYCVSLPWLSKLCLKGRKLVSSSVSFSHSVIAVYLQFAVHEPSLY
jgi:hypothetical protein